MTNTLPSITNYFEAVETCPHCGNENTYPMYDAEANGFVVKCNYCGKKIFLCDECIHASDGLNSNCAHCNWHKTKCGEKCFRGFIKYTED